MFKKWTDYKKSLESGESYSQRVTGSGHITVSALIETGGTLRAFPPKAGGKAFPLFVSWDATAGGKFKETLEGTYPRKGWELSCAMEQGRAILAGIFFKKYADVRERQGEAKRRAVDRRAVVEEILAGAELVVEVPETDPVWTDNPYTPIEELVLIRHFAGESEELSFYQTIELGPVTRLFQMNSVSEEFRFFVTRWDGESLSVTMVEIDKEQFDQISKLL